MVDALPLMAFLRSIKSKRMIGYIDVKHVFHRLLYLHDSRVAIFKDIARHHIDEMVVLLEFVRTLELCAVLPELMFRHQITIHQKLNRIVKSRFAHAELLVFHLCVKRINVKMAVDVINLLQNHESLGCLPEIMTLQILGEDVLHFLENVFFDFIHNDLQKQYIYL